jgi:hypothetical protein
MRLLFGIFVSISLALGLVIGGAAQEKLRTVDESDPRYTYKNPPVEIVSREFAGKTVAKGEQFRGDKDWLPKVVLRIRNNSRKTVVHLAVRFVIDEQGRMPAGIDISLHGGLGHPHGVLGPRQWPDGTPIPFLKPGETARISVQAADMKEKKPYLELYDAADFDRVAIEVVHVRFDDGTGWTRGEATRQDAQYPGRWSVEKPNPR